MSNVVAIHRKPHASLTPRTLEEAISFANMLAKSSIVPKDYQNNPGNVLVAIQWGLELGLQPLQAMQNIAVINGRPAVWGDAMLAIVRGSGLLEYITEEIEKDQATCTVKRVGEEPVTRVFTLEEAKHAGLLRDIKALKESGVKGKDGSELKPTPWNHYPKRMLQMRARAFALRDVFPDVLRGIGIAEEVLDIPVEKDMGAAEVVEPKETTAASKTESLRGKVAAKRGKGTDEAKAGEPVTLDAVLKAVDAARDQAGMSAAASLAARLDDEADKATAREAYAEKLAELKRAMRTDAKQEPVEMRVTYAQVAEALYKAADEDQLALAADMIRHVDAEQREELSNIYKCLLAEMAGPSEPTDAEIVDAED